MMKAATAVRQSRAICSSFVGHRGLNTKATPQGTQDYYENRWFQQDERDQVINSPSDPKKVLLNLEKERKLREKTGEMEHTQILPQIHQKSNLYIPPISLSCLRLSTQKSHHHDILPYAMEKGINFLETSTLFPDSQFILAEAINNFPLWVSRTQAILLSKAGFQTTETPQGITITGHSLDLDFMKNELTESLNRMTLHCLDFFVIQQPEMAFRNGSSPEDIYKQLEKIFHWLESEVTLGRIQHYGISSTAITLPSDHPQFLSLEEILRSAKRAKGGNNHHFSVVQVPFNLNESGYLTENNLAENSLSVHDFTRNEGLASITFRPLRDDLDFRFIEYQSHEEKDMEQLLKEAFDLAIGMERSYKETVQDNPTLPKFEEIAIAEMLLDSQENTPNIAVWKDTLDQTIIPYRKFILNQLTAKKPDTAEWATKYSIVTDTLLDRITWNLEHKNHKESEELCRFIDNICPALGGVPLQTKALRTVLSAGAESVSIGMRDIHFVADNLKALRFSPLPKQDLIHLLQELKRYKTESQNKNEPTKE